MTAAAPHLWRLAAALALVTVLTCVAVIATRGNPWAAVALVLAVRGVWALWRAPLRRPAGPMGVAPRAAQPSSAKGTS